MKEVNKYIILMLLVVLAAALSGCGKKQPEASEYYVFYVNKDNTKILPVPLESEAQEPEILISEMILKLCQEPESVDYKRPIPKNVDLVSWSLEKRQVYLNFGTEYSNLDHITEVLCRAAFVRTLTQLEEVDCVSFYIDEVPLMDEKGNPVGMMTAENFVENPGEQINSIQTANITLYFSSQKGDMLVEEVQEEVHYSSNISMEKLVMERLLKGPSNKDCVSAIPAGTKLVGVSVLDGVCFVNLDEGFLNQNYEIAEGVVIYSIVNSLVELPNVNKVQISVNGDTSITYREKFTLSSVYERNLDYLKTAEPAMDKKNEEQLKPEGEGDG